MRRAISENSNIDTIFHSRLPMLCALVISTLWVTLCLTLCNDVLPNLPAPYSTSVLAACNLLLLIGSLSLIWCVIRLFQKRPILRLGREGIWFQLSRTCRGRLSWDHIAQIALAPDGVSVQLRLCGIIEPDQHLSLTAGPGGSRVLTLPLRGKVRDPQNVCALLQTYQTRFASSQPVSFPLPEADMREQQRHAAMKRKCLSVLLTTVRLFSSKLWLLCLVLYLCASGFTAEALQLRQLAGLGICLPPFVLLWLLLRRLLAYAGTTVENAIQACEQCEAGI